MHRSTIAADVLQSERVRSVRSGVPRRGCKQPYSRYNRAADWLRLTLRLASDIFRLGQQTVASYGLLPYDSRHSCA